MIMQQPDEDLLLLWDDLILNFPEGIFIIDKKDQFFVFNPALEKITGISAKEIIGKNLNDSLSISFFQQYLSLWKEGKKSAKALDYEIELHTESAEKKILSGWCIPRLDKNTYNGMIFTVQDISRQKEVEIELKRTLEATTDAIWSWDFRTNELYFSPKYYTMLGYKPNAFKANYENWVNLMHPDDKEAALKNASEYLKTKPDLYENEFRLKTKQGNYRWLRAKARVVERDENGEALLLVGNHEDITERKKVEEELQQSKSLLDRAGHMARVGGWELDPATNKVTWTRETYLIHEVPLSMDPPLEKALEFWHPDDRPVLMKAIDKAVHKGEPYDLKLRFITATGKQLYARTQGQPLLKNGKVIKLQGTFQDITEQVHLVDELEAIFSTSNAMICIADINTATFLKINPAFSENLGYTEEELKGQSFMIFIHPDDLESTQKILEEDLQQGKKVRAFENRYQHKNGSYRWLLWNSSPIPDLGLTYAVAIDITDLKNAQTALQNQQRIESIGMLAGGIAHDFNNLLGGIFGNIELALDFSDDQKQIEKFLTHSLDAMDRAKELTQQLLTFSKGGDPVKEKLDLYPLLEQNKNALLENSQIHCEILRTEEKYLVDADINQLNQVFNNIILNAKQAMPDGGSLKIEIANYPVKSGDLPNLSAGEYVKISFQDTGSGIPHSLLNKIFDPFFSTKKTGAGLGLATAYSIMNHHGGSILVDSQLGRGTIFTLYLPCAVPANPNVKIENKDVSAKTKGRFLVMDDEPLMRDVAQKMLELQGFEVFCVSGGQEALSLFKSEQEAGRSFQYVLLDLTIPGGMGGEDVMREILNIDKNVIGIVASGYADSPVLSNPREYGFKTKIEKPFRKKTLEAVLDNLAL